MKDNPFTDRYKRLSNLKLLEILEFRDLYSDEARKAAEEEIRSRFITLEELIDLTHEIEEKRTLKINQDKKIFQSQMKISAFGPYFAELMHNNRLKNNLGLLVSLTVICLMALLTVLLFMQV